MANSSSGGATAPATTVELLNVSYDPTRELWKELNAAFKAAYIAEKGVDVKINPSHAASGAQARAIMDGQPADVATLSLFPDTDAIREAGLINEGWIDHFPNRSLPYTSTVVFVVRAGNPKGIKDWADLVKDGVEIVTPNPKTSGNGRMSFLGAWGSVLKNGGSEADATEFMRKFYKNAPVLDTGARGSTTTFAQKGQGDVHITMENEAYLEQKEAPGKFEIIYPSVSFFHEPHVAIVDKVVDKKGTREVAEAYLKFLYTPEGQEIIARNYFRPTDPASREKTKSQFPEITTFDITAVAKDWKEAQKKFFGDGGIFEQISEPAE
jgi:sulfate transport system substrate-binding protein